MGVVLRRGVVDVGEGHVLRGRCARARGGFDGRVACVGFVLVWDWREGAQGVGGEAWDFLDFEAVVCEGDDGVVARFLAAAGHCVYEGD